MTERTKYLDRTKDGRTYFSHPGQAPTATGRGRLGHTTPKLALYYCRLAQQKLLNDQAVAIMDDVFERRASDKAAKVAARRAAIKPVS